MTVSSSSISWIVLKKAAAELDAVRREYASEEDYAADRDALRDVLCHYFSTAECKSQMNNISPIGATKKGAKILKMRWARPGQGKSGGMRLIFAAYCDELRVKLAYAYVRRDAPGDDEINAAVSESDDI